MELEQIISFWIASVVLTLLPGPDNIFVLTESLTAGKRKGLQISVGLSLGIVVHTTAAATGLSLVLQESAFAFNVIKYLGAAYLFYLAINALKDKPLNVGIDSGQPLNQKGISLVGKGFLMNILNPKVSLFFIAFLPQFVVEGKLSLMSQMLILGAVFIFTSLTIFSFIVYLAQFFAPYLNSNRFWKITKISKVLTLSLLAISLTVSSK